jgi:tetratricopeptide (TPR) repeat protein
MSSGVRFSEQVMDNRLGPAEAHAIVRHKLGRLAYRWRLSPADVHSLARQMQTATYAAGETILRRGARADCLGLVVRGQVAVHASEGISAGPRAVLLPGSTFGEMMLAEGRPSPTTLRALTHTEIRLLQRGDLLALRAQQRDEVQTARLEGLARVAVVMLVLLGAALALLAWPGARQALVVAPMGLGQWCWDKGQPSCTGAAWQVAATLAPRDPGPLLALGTFYFEQGETAAAEDAFQAAGELAPDLPEVHNNLGLIYARQGDHERAIVAYAAALQLEPGVAAIEHNLGYSLQALGRNEQAVEHYEAALALDAPRVETLLNVAIAYYELGQHDRAREAAEQALQVGGDESAAYTLLAAVALELRQPETALANLEQALYLDAGYEQAYFYEGLAYKALDQPEAAILSFEQALAYANDEVTRTRIREHLDELHSGEGAQEGDGLD